MNYFTNFAHNLTENFNFNLTNDTINTIINTFLNLDILKSLFLIDGLLCATIFLKDILLLKIHTNFESSTLNSKFILDYQKSIIKKYNNIYTLDTFDRYIFYVIVYCIYVILNELEFDINYNFLIFLVIPYIQNNIIILLPYNKYLKNKELFIKYSISSTSF